MHTPERQHPVKLVSRPPSLPQLPPKPVAVDNGLNQGLVATLIAVVATAVVLIIAGYGWFKYLLVSEWFVVLCSATPCVHIHKGCAHVFCGKHLPLILVHIICTHTVSLHIHPRSFLTLQLKAKNEKPGYNPDPFADNPDRLGPDLPTAEVRCERGCLCDSGPGLGIGEGVVGVLPIGPSNGRGKPRR